MRKRIVVTSLLILFSFSALMYFAARAQGPWTLTVSSDHGSPSPAVGDHAYNDGDSVTCSVSSPVVDDGVSYTCTGWSGSGSVPASGTASSVTFIITETSSITWNWKTQYYLTVSSAYGVTGGQGWYDSGSTAYATVTPLTVPGGSGTQYVFTQWGGDASGNTSPSNAIVMSGPMTATANWKTQYYLTVSSVYGTPAGQGWYDSGSTAYATVTPLTVAGPSGTQYVFTVWSGDATGNTSPSDGITMNGPKTATANWKTQYYLTVSNGGHGTAGGQGWCDANSNAQATITPLTVAGTTGTQYVFAGWTGDASGSGSPSDNILMDGPKTATATWTTQYYLTVSSAYSTPSGSGWYDSGLTAYAGLAAGTVPGGAGTQYVFTSWSGDASGTNYAQSDGITMNGPKTATANWKTQYYLTVTSPYDSPTPVSGWFDSGSSVTESVTSPTPGPSGIQYVCTGWSGSGSVPGSGTSSSVPFTITTASSITWNWKTQYYLTVSSVYGTPGGQGWYDSGSTAYATVTPLTVPGASGVQYVFTVWGGDASGSASPSNPITMNGPKTATANWKTQYQVTFDKTGVGSDFTGTVVTVDSVNYNVAGLPISFWWDSGSGHGFSFASPLVVNASKQYSWSSTSGLSSLQSGTLTVTASGSVVGNYIVQNQVTFDHAGVSSDFTGTVVIIDSVSYSRSQLPVSFSWSVGSTHSFAFQSPLVVGSTTKQYLWTSTTGLSSAQSGSITITTYGNIISNYKTQYYLTVSSPHDSPSPVSGWFDYGSSITESVTSPVSGGSGTQYVCTGWTGTGSVPASGTASSITFTIAAPSSITWNWKTQYYLTVSSPYDSPSPISGWFDSGSSVTESVTSPTPGPSGTQYVVTGWTGTGSVPISGSGKTVTFTITAASSITWNWKTQYYLTVSSPYDSPTPSSGWFDSGSSITESVTSPVSDGSGTHYVCTGWTGTGSVPSSGSSSSVTFTITGASSITWNWQIVQRRLTVSSAHDSPNPGNGLPHHQ